MHILAALWLKFWTTFKCFNRVLNVLNHYIHLCTYNDGMFSDTKKKPRWGPSVRVPLHVRSFDSMTNSIFAVPKNCRSHFTGHRNVQWWRYYAEKLLVASVFAHSSARAVHSTRHHVPQQRNMHPLCVRAVTYAQYLHMLAHVSARRRFSVRCKCSHWCTVEL